MEDENGKRVHEVVVLASGTEADYLLDKFLCPFFEEARLIHEKLGTDYHEYADRGHFGHDGAPLTEFPELLESIREKL